METVILAILDGWGLGKKDETNPIYEAETRTIDYLQNNFPGGSLNASGLSVGLPWGESGKSGVGHLTIGAGKIKDQYCRKITKSIEKGDFFDNKKLRKAFTHAEKNDSNVHVVGLLTAGKVHASLEHLKALIRMGGDFDVNQVYLHLFTDGVDSSSKSASSLIEETNKVSEKVDVGKIGSLSGRYYAMDRSRDWNKTKKVYEAMTGQAETHNINELLEKTYKEDLDDRYVKPSVINENSKVQDGDSIIFFNFRGDSSYQIAKSFAEPEFNKFETKDFDDLLTVTMTKYQGDLPSKVAYEKRQVRKPLGKVLEEEEKMQLKIAESKKENHVTYFFNGLRNKAFEKEFRIIIPSDKHANPAKKPKMKAKELTDRALLSLEEGNFAFIIINYANLDIISHTGDNKATIEAVEFVDKQLGKLLNSVLKRNAALIATSDHGNAEEMFTSSTGKVDTTHTTNPVPVLMAASQFEGRGTGRLEKTGMLSDVAPTVLDLLDIKKPVQMSGNSLVDIFT